MEVAEVVGNVEVDRGVVEVEVNCEELAGAEGVLLATVLELGVATDGALEDGVGDAGAEVVGTAEGVLVELDIVNCRNAMIPGFL